MLKTRTSLFFIALLAMVLLVAACGPSEEQLRARDAARAAALAAEARAVSLRTSTPVLTRKSLSLKPR